MRYKVPCSHPGCDGYGKIALFTSVEDCPRCKAFDDWFIVLSKFMESRKKELVEEDKWRKERLT